jgi:hypothetical protein
MIILGIDTSTINWYLFGYIIFSIFFLFYGTSQVYATGQIRGVIFAIGTSLILLSFGLHWFGVQNTKVKQWPPVINTCPDYLTFVPNIASSAGSSTTVPGCVDMLGVSVSSNSANAFVKVFPTSIPTLDATMKSKVFTYTSADVRAATSAGSLQPICDACQSAGLTWEGVYDGDSCIGVNKVEARAAATKKCIASI